MTYIAPNHYSYKFKLDIDNLPTRRTDKFSSFIAVWGIICGLIFIALGAYEILSYFWHTSNEAYNFKHMNEFSAHQLFILRYSFDTFILLFGVIILYLAFAALRRRKVISFDGKNITIKHQPMFGKSHTESEALYNYIGVLLKVEYYQIGLITRNRYIIELYHKEKNKRIPLYISTSAKNTRRIWEQYADKLKMPALFMTDHGLVSKHHDELNKTLKQMSERWHLDALYHSPEDTPHSVKYKVKKDKVILKERRLFFDVYTILSLLLLALLTTLCIWALANYETLKLYVGSIGFAAVLALVSTGILFALCHIFSKDVLIIKDNNLILGHNFAFIRTDVTALPKDEIESVDIGHNPITDRYYLSIISHNDNVVFGKNMPIDDLRWIRGCIIREVVK